MVPFKKLYTAFDYFIFEAYRINANYLGLFRILYCSFIFVFYGVPNYSWLSSDLNYLFAPPDVCIANLFQGFPDNLFFTGASIAVVILYILLFFGWRTKIVSLLLFFLVIICQSFAMSFGKIDHNIIWLVIPFFMAFSGWGNAYSVDAYQQRYEQENAWAVSLLALVLGFAMFTASIPKILSGWLSPDTQSTLSHLVYNAVYWDKEPLLYNLMLTIKSNLFWEFLDYITVMFEFGFLVAVMRPQVFRFFVLAAVVFHLFIFLTFSIVFTHNLLAYLLFVNWSVFYPVISSNFFINLVRILYRPRVLAFCVSLIALFGYLCILSGKSFSVPAVSGLILTSINQEDNLRVVNTFILFTIALIIATASVYKFIFPEKASKTFSLPATNLFKDGI